MVTGGAGFVGSHIVDRLLARGDDVLVVDDLSTGSASNLPGGVDLEEMDVASPKLLDVASAWRPEALTHAAAQPSVPVSMSDPLLDAHSKRDGWTAGARSSGGSRGIPGGLHQTPAEHSTANPTTCPATRTTRRNRSAPTA